MFVRDPRHRLVAGVTAGLGNRIGVDPLVVRIALVVLALAGGAGVVIYGVAWLLSRDAAPDEVVVVHEFESRQGMAVALMTLGLTLAMRSLGLWFSDALVWPALVAGTVSATIWIRTGPDGDGTATEHFFDLSPARVIVASLILFAGAITFWVVVDRPLDVVIPLAGIVIGGTLLASPWLTSLWRRLERQRATAARQQARDEVAAHLHDSVLQTLTLIQRTEEPRRATTLARTQERELRAWLYGDRDPDATTRTLETAMNDLVSHVEAHQELDVDVVVVGSVADVDEYPRVRALLAAVREALVNVAHHAQVTTASLYVEVDDDRITAFVRDRGVGFDPEAVPQDRRGLRDSIHGRLRRHGGGGLVHTDRGHGTEVEAWVPHVPTNASNQAPAVPDHHDPPDNTTTAAVTAATPVSASTTRDKDSP